LSQSLLTQIQALSLLLRRAAQWDDSHKVLTLAQKNVLQSLEINPLTVPEIARARATSRQNIQALVNRLVKEGFVETIINPAHRRSVLFGLTAKGRTLLKAAEEHQFDLAALLTNGASTEELQTVVRVLHRLRDLLQEKKGQTPQANNGRVRTPGNRAIQHEPAVGLPEDESQDPNFPVNLL